jgi:predicted permease
MDYISIYKEIIVLFLVMGVGYFSSKLGVITSSAADEISNLIMKVTFPALIIVSMNQTFNKELLINSIGILIISICVHLALILVAYLWSNWFDIPQEKMSVLRFIIIFGNTTFMGYPIINAVFGELGLFYASSYNLFTILLIFSYGIILLSKRGSGNILKKLLNPGFIAVIVGYILFFMQVEFPYVILSSLHLVGNLTIPLALIIIGNSLASIQLKELFVDKQLWYISLLRLIVIPVILLIILKQLELNNHLVGISVIMTAIPAALFAGVFARTYGCDGNLGDRGAVLTHILSIITIPLIIYLL